LPVEASGGEGWAFGADEDAQGTAAANAEGAH